MESGISMKVQNCSAFQSDSQNRFPTGTPDQEPDDIVALLRKHLDKHGLTILKLETFKQESL